MAFLMTERLNWSAPDELEFDARVISAAPREGITEIVLDGTAFHPESGGQPCDLGLLDAARVVHVRDDEGRVVHLVEGAAPPEGAVVRGKVDAARRLDHSCQHTAQHIVSAVALRDFGAATVGFHLGEEASTVDLEPALDGKDALLALEDAANREAFVDRPVISRVVDGNDRPRCRRDAAVREGEPLRVVEIEGLDVTACCGTHLARTSQVGLIRLSRTEIVRGATRVELRAGLRTLALLRRLEDLTVSLSASTGSGPWELPAWVEAARAETRRLAAEAASLRKEVAGYEAAALLSRSRICAGGRVVAEIVPPRPPVALRELASRVVARPGTVALLGAVWEDRAVVAFARSAELSLHMGDVMRSILPRIRGKGGGRPDMAQGGGEDARGLAAAIESALRLVSESSHV
ncbi:MAG: DHHA1 domain-containing protein [Deltaproteobacteria bacterium]|nr:DHHA1 domain-containing protein [Deltaproteobacteria bacterium]